MCERLISQVQRQAKEEKELTAKAAAHLKAGNRKLAGEYALRLQKVKEEHQANVDQLEEAEKTYEELKRARDVSVKAAKEKIESLKRDIDETRIAKATAELNEMAAGMISEIGGAGDTLNRLEEMVTEEREKAKGRARVAKDSIDVKRVTGGNDPATSEMVADILTKSTPAPLFVVMASIMSGMHRK
mgnify:CR=1 FL=1